MVPATPAVPAEAPAALRLPIVEVSCPPRVPDLHGGAGRQNAAMGEDDATGAHPLRSLRLVFWGLIAVVVDVRIDGPDVVPDPVGWLVALVGVARLARLHPGFGVAALGCGLGLLVSLPDWAQPGDGSMGLLTGVAETVVVFGTCTGVIALLPARRATAATIRGWDLGLMLAVAALTGLAGLDARRRRRTADRAGRRPGGRHGRGPRLLPRAAVQGVGGRAGNGSLSRVTPRVNRR